MKVSLRYYVMKNKNTIILLTVVVTLLCIYYLSITFFSRGIQQDAVDFAKDESGIVDQTKKQSYLDSISCLHGSWRSVVAFIIWGKLSGINHLLSFVQFFWVELGIETGISSAKLSQPRVRVSRQKAPVVWMLVECVEEWNEERFCIGFYQDYCRGRFDTTVLKW